MSMMIASKIDLSPIVFGQADDHVTIHAQACDDVWELLASLEAQGRGSAVAVGWPGDDRMEQVRQCVRGLVGKGIRADVVELPDGEQDAEAITRMLMPVIGPMVLALSSGQHLALYWPAQCDITPLRQAVHRVVRWRASWCSLDDWDGISAPAELD